MSISFGLNVVERVEHDVVDVVVGYRIDNLAAALFSVEKICAAQYSQVLGDHRLGRTRCLDELVHAARLVHHGDEQR